jgi:hypothetical protein
MLTRFFLINNHACAFGFYLLRKQLAKIPASAFNNYLLCWLN